MYVMYMCTIYRLITFYTGCMLCVCENATGAATKLVSIRLRFLLLSFTNDYELNTCVSVCVCQCTYSINNCNLFKTKMSSNVQNKQNDLNKNFAVGFEFMSGQLEETFMNQSPFYYAREKFDTKHILNTIKRNTTNELYVQIFCLISISICVFT